MEENTHPESTRTTLDMNEYLNKWENDGIPRWQARRIAVKMSHADISTRTLLE